MLSCFNFPLQERGERRGGIRGGEEGKRQGQQVRIIVEYSFSIFNHVTHCILSLNNLSLQERGERRGKGNRRRGRVTTWKQVRSFAAYSFPFLNHAAHFLYSLSLSLSFYLCRNKEGDAGNTWGRVGETAGAAGKNNCGIFVLYF